MKNKIGTSKKWYLKLMISFFVFNLNLSAAAQIEKKNIKNFAGILLPFDFSNGSHAVGVEYERVLYRLKKVSLSTRGNHIFKYKSSNLFLRAFDISGGSPSKGEYSISLSQIWGAATLYTSGTKANNGFFFNAALGLAYSKRVRTKRTPLGPNIYHDLFPGLEGGVGIQFQVSGKNNLRIVTTFSYLHGKDKAGSNSGTAPRPDNDIGFVFLTGKVLLGF